MYTFKIYEPVKRNIRPVDNGTTIPSKIPVAKYYRKTLNCNCDSDKNQGFVTQVFKDKNCCKNDKDKIVRSSIINKETVNSGYCMDYNQYLKKKCMTYEQRNVPKPSCNNECKENNVYKRTNNTFATNGAVSSSLKIESVKQDALYYQN